MTLEPNALPAREISTQKAALCHAADGVKHSCFVCHPSTMQLTQIPLTQIIARCSEQYALYTQRKKNDSRYCLELFRRALAEKSDLAWSAVYNQYEKAVSTWIIRHPSFVHCHEDAEYFVNPTFARMWKAISPERFIAFSDLKQVLQYLKACVHSEIHDYLRTSRKSVELSEQVASNVEQFKAVLYSDLWTVLGQRLDEAELLLFYLRYHEGLMPRQIVEEHPELGRDAKQISRRLENILAKLRRTEELQKLFEEKISDQ